MFEPFFPSFFFSCWGRLLTTSTLLGFFVCHPFCFNCRVDLPRCAFFSLPWWLSGKESACNAGDPVFYLWLGKIPWRREWQPTLVLLWRIPWTEEPGELQSIGSQRVGHDWSDGITDLMDMGLGGLQDGRSGVLRFMGSQRVGHDWATELNWTEVTEHARLPY